MICRSVKIWSPQDLPFGKLACSLRISGPMAGEILSRITLLKPLLVTDDGVIPLQLLHIFGSPFFANLTISLVFQSLNVSSSSHLSSKISMKVLTMISPPAFPLSALTPSAPGALPDFMELTAFLTSSTDDGSVVVFVAYWSIFHLHLRVGSAIPVITFTSLHWNFAISKTATECLYYIVQCSDSLIFSTVSASSANFAMKAFLSAFVRLFTSLSSSRYLACNCSLCRWHFVSFSNFFCSSSLSTSLV